MTCNTRKVAVGQLRWISMRKKVFKSRK